MDALKDIPRKGKRLFDKRVLSNGKEMESPSTAFLILSHFKNHVISTSGEAANLHIHGDVVVEWMEENCCGLYFTPSHDYKMERLFAFEKTNDAMLFKLRFG